jgi:hypothetical protein
MPRIQAVARALGAVPAGQDVAGVSGERNSTGPAARIAAEEVLKSQDRPVIPDAPPPATTSRASHGRAVADLHPGATH